MNILKYLPFFKSSSWLIAEKLLKLVNGLVVVAATARYLGPSNFGTLSFALSVVSIFGSCCGMGADYINQTEISRFKESRWSFISTAFYSRLIILTLVSSIFVPIILKYLSTNFILLWGLLLSSSLSIFGHSLLAGKDFEKYAKVNSFGVLAGALLRLIAIILHLGLEWFFAIVSLEAILISTGFVFIQRNKIFNFDFFHGFSLKQCKWYLELCLPTLLSAVLVTIYFRLEFFFLYKWLSANDAGQWSIVQTILQPWQVLFVALLPVVNSKLTHDDLDKTKSNIVLVLKLSLALGLFAIAINTVASKTILPLLLGGGYSKALNLVPIASLSIIPVFFGGVQDLFISHRRSTSTVLKKVCLSLPLSFLCLFFMVKAWGLQGATISLVCAHFFSAILINFIFDKQFFFLSLQSVGIKK